MISFRDKKGLTGADIATAVSIIVFTVGIVTSIYINTISKSKDSVRYANAVRIATSIIENIQKMPYEYLTSNCNPNIQAENGEKIFNTKVQNGFIAIVTANKVNDLDIARDVNVIVKYKTKMSYKSISINTVKEKELMDLTNPPDISLIPNYNPSNNNKYYYPVIVDSNNRYRITSYTDINWYNYEKGKYAIICETTDGTFNVGQEVPGGTDMYVWIPRFVSKDGSGLENLKFLYGASNYIISLNSYGNLSSYGLEYIGLDPVSFDNNTFEYNGFSENDGLSGVWFKVGETYDSNNKIHRITNIFTDKIYCQDIILNLP